jgi:hypothetical protein
MKVIPPPPSSKNDFKSPYCSPAVIARVKKQIQKEIQVVPALKLAPSLIEDLCQIVEDNFKDLE